MLSFLLLGSAFACTLSVDPNGKCVTDVNGFSILDADSDADIPISLTISTKGETTDAFSKVHPATSGALDFYAADGRYILACPQGGDDTLTPLKTVKMTVSRPASLTAFGAEWVQLFPKDSFENVTNEYEPFTFNEYGAKIPLPEFRPTTTGLADDAPTKDEINVFMEIEKEGDYEIMYGNPNLVADSKWVAVQFKSTFLRVGAPWADCSGSTLGASSYSVGSIMPVLFGGPNTNSIALKAGNPNYFDVITELSGVTVPVKVVLEIFNADKTSYTSSASDGQCYKAGNACPEAHAVCKAEYCELDVWAQLIADFKAASPGLVTVLGSIDASTATSAYDGLAMDGFYFVGTPVTGTGTTVAATGEPLFDENAVDDATVYVTLASSELGVWNPFSWYADVAPSKWAAIVTSAADTSAIAELFDRGYGYVFLTSEAGFDTKSSITADVLTAIEATATRRLQERRLTASAPFWSCDDTLFECKPVCLKKMGVVTTKVSDTLCSAAPMDQCACKCYHEAQWTCEGDSVVCKAKFGAGELKTVGDKVCETRGAKKPASAVELRVASQCEPMTEMRGSAPASECLAQWGTPEPTDAPVPATEAPAAEAPAKVEKVAVPIMEESFATALALAALALYA
jgi:hypothetical protein